MSPVTDEAPIECGRDALEHHAPEAFSALASLEASVWGAFEPGEILDWFSLGARVATEQHGLPTRVSLLRPPRLGSDPWQAEAATSWRRFPAEGQGALCERGRAALRFAEQMSFDVQAVGDEERRGLFSSLGPAAAPFTQAMYVADVLPRMRFALDALFGQSDWATPTATPRLSRELWPAIEEHLRAIAALDDLDPLTTELVRLLGARRHRCRLCQSRRSRPALEAGGSESLFDAVEHYGQNPAFSAAQKTALALTEAMVTQPATVDGELLASLREHWSEAQQVELVLDIGRNATNKIPVALSADQANVEDAVEIFDVGPDGELTVESVQPLAAG